MNDLFIRSHHLDFEVFPGQKPFPIELDENDTVHVGFWGLWNFFRDQNGVHVSLTRDHGRTLALYVDWGRCLGSSWLLNNDY